MSKAELRSIGYDERTSMGRRMRFFVSRAIISHIKSKWTIAILVISYALLFVPRLFMTLAMATPFDASFYATYFSESDLFILLLVAVVGSGVIANDMKDGSLVLLFTTSFGRMRYVIGRVATVFLLTGLLTVLPPLMLLIVALLASAPSMSVFVEGGWVIGGVIGFSLMITGFYVLVVSALSSAFADRRYAGAALFFIVLVSDIVRLILSSITSSSYVHLVSVFDNISMVASYFFRSPPPFPVEQGYSALVLLGAMAASSYVLYTTLIKREVVT